MLVKVPPLDKPRALSNAIVGAPVHWVKQLLLESCCSRGQGQGELPKGSTGLSWAARTPRAWCTLAPCGKRAWEAGPWDSLRQHSRSSSRWGTAGREECLGQGFTLSRTLPLRPGSSQGAQGAAQPPACSLHYMLEEFGRRGLLRVLLTCANKERTACTG